MICQPCKDREHGRCPGGTWCDCQHRESQTAKDNARKVAARQPQPRSRP